jgi:MFS-type transporter involved in bile tolerance (Atg22 family)
MFFKTFLIINIIIFLLRAITDNEKYKKFFFGYLILLGVIILCYYWVKVLYGDRGMV